MSRPHAQRSREWNSEAQYGQDELMPEQRIHAERPKGPQLASKLVDFGSLAGSVKRAAFVPSPSIPGAWLRRLG